jgi:hypothetical protein
LYHDINNSYFHINYFYVTFLYLLLYSLFLVLLPLLCSYEWMTDYQRMYYLFVAYPCTIFKCICNPPEHLLSVLSPSICTQYNLKTAGHGSINSGIWEFYKNSWTTSALIYWQFLWPLYIKKCINFWAYIENNSLNVY